jgi:mRNA interferase MazF
MRESRLFKWFQLLYGVAKKAGITTNVEIHPSKNNGLSKKSIADCLQTRPIDHSQRLVKIRGKLSSAKMHEIDQALRIVFELN